MARFPLFALLAASLTTAHFTLNWPPTAGFIDDDEPTAPCGGATVTVNDTAPEVQVDQFAVSIFSSHPAGSWSFFATTNTEAPYNFTQIVPVINSTGTGTFCLTDLRAPSDFAGKLGVLQVIDASVDGTLYQCAPVKFISGSNTTTGSSCSNQTNFQAIWTSETTNPSGSSASPSRAAASSTSSAAAAAMATGMGSLLGLGMMAAGLVL